MPQQKKSLALLAAIMVIIATSLSLAGSKLLYETSLTEQRHRLHELVQSQASLAKVLFQHYERIDNKLNIGFDIDKAIRKLASAQREFKIQSKSGEFTVAQNTNGHIKFLIVNGDVVLPESPLRKVTFDSKEAIPMKKALKLSSGTIIGLDYKDKEVLAAYTPMKMGDLTLGMVAKIDMKELRNPFIITNIKILVIGIILIAIGIFLFKKFSEPLIIELEEREREYRELVENVNMIILKVASDGSIIFANQFAKSLFVQDRNIVGLNILDLLSGEDISDEIDNKDVCFKVFFGDGKVATERPFETSDGKIRWIAWRAWQKEGVDGAPNELLCIGNDITAKYVAQMSLQNSEFQYRNLFENAPLAMVHFDSTGMITDCNNIFIEMMGAPREKLIGFNVAESKRSQMRAALTVALNGEQSTYEDLYTSVTGGKTTFIHAIFNPVKSLSSQIEVIATLEDISTRKKIEHELLDSEERFREIINAAPVGMIISDFDDQLIFANKRVSELTGIKTNDSNSKSWIDLLHPEDVTVVTDKWSRGNFVNRKPLEVRFINDSVSVWTIAHSVNLEHQIDSNPCYVVTFTNISVLKESEEQQKRLIAAIEQSIESIVITNTSGIITYVNPAFEKISGYTKSEAVGQNSNILKSSEQTQEFYTNLWKTISQGNIWSGQFVNRNKEGKSYTQEATICPVRNENGQIINYVGVARDISKQLIVEAQLRQAQKLESIGELAAGIAHEINTPTQYVSSNMKFLEDSFVDLMTMVTSCDTAFKSLAEGKPQSEVLQYKNDHFNADDFEFLSEDVPKAIEESVEGLKRISKIVQSIKQLAHPGETHKGFFDLNNIIKDAVTVSSNEWKYVAEIDLQLEESLPQIQCMKGEMGQVLLNLIINSAHAIEAKGSSEKGTISITTKHDATHAILEVADTGSGMSSQVIERAFDPFFTTKEVGKGTGQGLAIAHNVIANIHKGNISVESKEGVGTKFLIQLPFTE
ncbi:PAS domain S-box protein [Maridesulfovibrio frigidus]|uniref:PAS domain S-box protein n=1 Tax=Maridesulfovibrio frigidus TaxID=340956 RepID=UPI00068AC154|nr:PAS domain S-box protein [Maridesulfovibrio frigidus]